MSREDDCQIPWIVWEFVNSPDGPRTGATTPLAKRSNWLAHE